jgi:hypothetical protein
MKSPLYPNRRARYRRRDWERRGLDDNAETRRDISGEQCRSLILLTGHPRRMIEPGINIWQRMC